MKGNNKLVLNYATVMEALQEYFDARTTPSARFHVASIEATGSSNYDKVITVQIENGIQTVVPMADDAASAA
jgi:hypothetical protein